MSIRLDNVNYIYSENTVYEISALKNINLNIGDKEFIGVIGHTGSGKSTLIQHLNGLIHATSGAIYFNDENIYDPKYNLQKLRCKVGLVFQYPEHQLFEIDVFTDVCFGPKNLGLPEHKIHERAAKALEQVGISKDLYEKSPFELSGGQKRRVAIAGVLAMEPDVLILDEPTAALDPKGREDILGQIDQLYRQREMTIILVSHSMEDIAEYVDRLIVMNEGEIKYDGTPKQVFSRYQELEKIGLRAPQITYAMAALQKNGFNINDNITTVKEAKDEIMRIFSGMK